MKPNNFSDGDKIIVKREPSIKKSGLPYDPDPYVVTLRKGTTITGKKKGKEITRNSSFFKQVDPIIHVDLEDTEDEEIHPNRVIPDGPAADNLQSRNDDSETPNAGRRYPMRSSRRPPAYLKEYVQRLNEPQIILALYYVEIILGYHYTNTN